MDNEIWSDALNEISDEHLEEALDQPKKISWLGVIASTVAAAMVLVLVTPLVMLVLIFQPSGSMPEQPPNEGSGQTGAVTTLPTTPISPTSPTITTDPTLPTTPLINLAQVISQPSEARNQTPETQAGITSLSRQAMTTSRNFMHESMELVLSDATDNALWSPISAYMALATTAYLSSGSTQQELLDALGAVSAEDLVSQATAVWETVYYAGDYEKSVLAGSVWVDTAVSYNQPLLARLSYDLYNSVYYADLGTAEADASIRAWVNENTGNLLTDATEGISLPEETALVIYATIHFQSKWQDEFHILNTKQDLFHSAQGDVLCDFMTKSGYVTDYYWGSNFGAICLDLKNGSKMWLILPDEGIFVDQILASSEYLQLISSGYDPAIGESNWHDSVRTKVNLAVPKFDISCQVDLDPILKQLGIEEIFDPSAADFSEAFPGGALWLEGANQAIRVSVDEEGVTAAAYTEFPAPGSAPPPEEIVDFLLNRPFLFVITQDQIPLFAGVINDPTA